MPRSILAGSAALTVGIVLVACNAIVGINEPVDPAGSSGTIGSSGTVSSSGSSGSSGTSGTSGSSGLSGSSGTSGTSGTPSGLQRFIGTWATATRQASLTCGTETEESLPTFQITLGAGDNGELILSPQTSTDCKIGFSVSGNTATVLPNQKCVFQTAAATETYYYVDPSSIVLSANGQSVTVTFKAYDFVVLTAGGSGNCTFVEDSVYTKVP